MNPGVMWLQASAIPGVKEIMEYHLNRTIRLSLESEYKNLYSWSLQEVSGAGEQIGMDQVPWPWSLIFSASELRYNKTLRIEREADPNDILPSSAGVSNTESISAVLHPGAIRANGNFEREATFSMFGTDRVIENFSLIIQQLQKDDSKDVCSMWGCVSYTSEIDSRTKTEDDILQISVAVSSERFKELRELVNHVKPDVLVVRLGRVAGFYSEWSPSVSTNRIKVLTSESEHKVESPDGCDVDPPRLGEVGEFALTAMCRNTLQLKQESDSWDSGGELDDDEEGKLTEPDQGQGAIIEQLAKSGAAFEKLKWPIWFIVVLLLLLYLK
jgi:hypothetical protein